MKSLQRYIFGQTLWPAVLCLSALATLALLTQSLQTLDLIVENRQSGLTFLYITVLALPQLVSIILPLAVFMAALYALNRMNGDSELIVAKAAGATPWQIGTPLIRLGVYALIAHLVLNLLIQPLSFRQMRAEILKVKTDVASQMVQAGSFVSPSPGLTVYARELTAEGELLDVLIHDARDDSEPTTHTAKSGVVRKSAQATTLILRDGSVQTKLEDGGLDVIVFDNYQLDLSDVVALDNVLRLKSSDRFLHELLRPDPRDYIPPKFKRELAAEGHARLSAPLYSVALVMLALCFMVRGQHQRLGYGRKIAICAVTGFIIRLIGFALASAAEGDPGLNPVQYVWPGLVIVLCGAYLLSRRRIRTGRKRAERRYAASRVLSDAPS